MASILVNGIHRVLNLKQNTRDPRDFLRLLSPAQIEAIPPAASVMDVMPPAYDQGNGGTCAGQGMRRAAEFLEIKTGAPRQVSALFPYWNARDDQTQDTGCSVRDIMAAGAKQGLCSESLWPYNTANICVRPPDAAFVEGKGYLALKYTASQSLDEVRSVIAHGYPVVFGTAVYPSFESAPGGVIPAPTADEVANGPLGFHCMVLGAYDTVAGTFSGYNSWGEGWGDKGRFTIIEPYLAQFGSDYEDLTEMENGQEAPPCPDGSDSWYSWLWRWL